MPPPSISAIPDTPARAWLARFGRTVANQVTDAIAERLEGNGDSQATAGGQSLPLGWTGNRGGAGNAGAHANGTDGARTLTALDLLLGSSFRLNLAGDEAAARGTGLRWTAWGRAAASRFGGEAGGYSLDGDVTTATLGADAARGRWLAGLALAHSIGAGGYGGRADTTEPVGRRSGKAESSSTSLHPYLRLQASEHLSFWGTRMKPSQAETRATAQVRCRWRTPPQYRLFVPTVFPLSPLRRSGITPQADDPATHDALRRQSPW